MARTWTEREIRDLGVTTNLENAASILGISRASAYNLAKTHDFPVPVIHAGSRYSVPVHPILVALGLEPASPRATPIPA